MLTLLVLAVCIIVFITEKSRFQEIIIGATTVVGAIAIWFQMKRSKDMAEGEFILTLNQSFSTNDDLRVVYHKLVTGAPLVEEDRVAIVEYLTFFETIHLLVQRDVVDLKLLDDLFRYRFFIAVNNVDIQEMELLPDAKYYRNIYTLYADWLRYFSKRTDVTPVGRSLVEANPQFEKYVNARGSGSG